MTTTEIQTQALSNATQNGSMINYPTIIRGFMEKGIQETDIKPRENVFTFNAWKALGRSVKKGEHGVKVITFLKCSKTVENKDGTEGKEIFSRPWHTTVFHISQTDMRA